MPDDFFDGITEEIIPNPMVSNDAIGGKYFLNGYTGKDVMEDLEKFGKKVDWDSLVLQFGTGMLDQFVFCKFKQSIRSMEDEEKEEMMNMETPRGNSDSNSNNNNNNSTNSSPRKPDWLVAEDCEKINIWARILFDRDNFNLEQWCHDNLVLEIGQYCFRKDWMKGVSGAEEAGDEVDFNWNAISIQSITELSDNDKNSYRCINPDIISRYLDYDPKEYFEKVKNFNLLLNAPPSRISARTELINSNKNDLNENSKSKSKTKTKRRTRTVSPAKKKPSGKQSPKSSKTKKSELTGNKRSRRKTKLKKSNKNVQINDESDSDNDQNDNNSSSSEFANPKKKRKISKNPLDTIELSPRTTTMILRSSTREKTQAMNKKIMSKQLKKAQRTRKASSVTSKSSTSSKTPTPPAQYGDFSKQLKSNRGKKSNAKRGRVKANRGRGGGRGRGRSRAATVTSNRGKGRNRRNGYNTRANSRKRGNNSNNILNDTSSDTSDGESSTHSTKTETSNESDSDNESESGNESNSSNENNTGDENGSESGNESGNESQSENKTDNEESGNGSHGGSSGSETVSEELTKADARWGKHELDHDADDDNDSNDNENTNNKNKNDNNANKNDNNENKNDNDENKNENNENANVNNTNTPQSDAPLSLVEFDPSVTTGNDLSRVSENEFEDEHQELQNSGRERARRSQNSAQQQSGTRRSQNSLTKGGKTFTNKDNTNENNNNTNNLGTILGDSNNPVIEYISQAEWDVEHCKNNSKTIVIIESGSPMTSSDDSIPPQAVTSIYGSNSQIVSVLHRGLWLPPSFNGCILDTSVMDMPSKYIFEGDYSTRGKTFISIPRNVGIVWLHTNNKNKYDGSKKDIVKWNDEHIEKYHNYLITAGVSGKTRSQNGKTVKSVNLHNLHYAGFVLHMWDRQEMVFEIRRTIRLVLKPGGPYDVSPGMVYDQCRDWKAQPGAIKDIMNQLYCGHWQKVAGFAVNLASGKLNYNTCSIEKGEYDFLPNLLDPKTVRFQMCNNQRGYVIHLC